jgi:hypothetical protein
MSGGGKAADFKDVVCFKIITTFAVKIINY